MVKQVHEANADQPAEVLGRWGSRVAAVWIFGGAVFFFVSFSLVFYTSHEPGIDAAARRIGEALGLR